MRRWRTHDWFLAVLIVALSFLPVLALALYLYHRQLH